MVIPHDRVSRLDEHPDLTRDSRKASEMALVAQDSRQSTKDKQTVIVDMREFRSELPSLLHRRGIDIIPVTIEVAFSIIGDLRKDISLLFFLIFLSSTSSLMITVKIKLERRSLIILRQISWLYLDIESRE